MNIKSVEMINKVNTIKQIIYVPKYISEEDIIKAVTQTIYNDKYYKFNPKGIKGAENVKNSTHLWYDSNHNIWQVCGKVKDLNNNDIPNCWYVRVVGIWYDFKNI